jgi:hypothetical protein
MRPVPSLPREAEEPSSAPEMAEGRVWYVGETLRLRAVVRGACPMRSFLYEIPSDRRG